MTDRRVNARGRATVDAISRVHPIIGPRSAAIFLRNAGVPLHVALRVIVGRNAYHPSAGIEQRRR